jgi:nucleotide-binding universal stress UspA family protein
VADGLLRRTPCPILVIRPQEGEELDPTQSVYRHILVTLDGSPESREVLPYATGLASLFGARITLLRVIPPHFVLGSTYIPHPSREAGGLEVEETAARAQLDAEARALQGHGLAVGFETMAGAHPVEGILRFVGGSDVDLVAMATHGRGGVARLILGSVADKVIRGGSVPVLLHRAP